MKAQVVGYQSCDFKDDDGRRVQGISLKCLLHSSSESLVGCDVAKIWLSNEIVSKVGFVPDVGSIVNLEYDFDGRRAKLVSYSISADDEF